MNLLHTFDIVILDIRFMTFLKSLFASFRSDDSGFTLSEMLIVISTILLLGILAVIALTSSQQQARDTKRIADVTALKTAMELYWTNTADYPEVTVGSSTWETLQSDLSNEIASLPLDPNHGRGGAYIYMVNPDNRDEFVVIATLENGTEPALANDIDSPVGGGWVAVDSQGNTVLVEAAGYSCADPIYCVEGSALD